MANLKENVLVEGTNWNVARINELHKSKEDFVKTHIDDEGTYGKIERSKKEKILGLAWQAIQDNTPKIPAPPVKTAATI